MNYKVENTGVGEVLSVTTISAHGTVTDITHTCTHPCMQVHSYAHTNTHMCTLTHILEHSEIPYFIFASNWQLP